MKKSYLSSWDKDQAISKNVIGILFRFVLAILVPVIIHCIVLITLALAGVNLLWGTPAILLDMKLAEVNDAAVFLGDPRDNKKHRDSDVVFSMDELTAEGMKYTYIERHYYNYFDYDFSKIEEETVSIREGETRPRRKDDGEIKEELPVEFHLTDYEEREDGSVIYKVPSIYTEFVNEKEINYCSIYTAPTTPFQAVKNEIKDYGVKWFAIIYIAALVAAAIAIGIACLLIICSVKITVWIIRGSNPSKKIGKSLIEEVTE